MRLAPIALFVYNRPEHTLKTLEALAQNDLASQSELFVFCDGPKHNADAKTNKAIKKVIAKATMSSLNKVASNDDDLQFEINFSDKGVSIGDLNLLDINLEQ